MLPSRSSDSGKSFLQNLINELCQFKAIRIVESGEDQKTPRPLHGSGDDWFIKFRMSQDVLGWWTLEFFVGLINQEVNDIGPVKLRYVSSAPYIHVPGQSLIFILEGKGINPNRLANFIHYYSRNFITPTEWEENKDNSN